MSMQQLFFWIEGRSWTAHHCNAVQIISRHCKAHHQRREKYLVLEARSISAAGCLAFTRTAEKKVGRSQGPAQMRYS
jgi:hypothetical protein